MKFGISVGLMLIVIPIQATILNTVSLVGVRPDLCLISAVIGGFWFGPVFGLIVGLTLGFGQDLFSAGNLWLNLIIKGAIGFLAGILAKNLKNATSNSIFVPMAGFSIFCSVVLLVSSRTGLHLGEFLEGVPTILVPQLLFDSVIGTGVNWVIRKTIPHEIGL